MQTHSIRQHGEEAAVGGKDSNLRALADLEKSFKFSELSHASFIIVFFLRYIIKFKIAYVLQRENHMGSAFLLIS